MQLSTKARYATRALVELAIRYGQGPVKLKDVAESQNISLKYLEQVMNPLRVSGYVKTHKGSRGGYSLSRSPDQINLYDVVQCVEGPLNMVDCLADPGLCQRVKLCATRDVWKNVKEAISRELSGITLAELAEKQIVLNKKQHKNA